MKKFLAVLGGLFLLLLVGGAGLIGYAAVKGFKLDAESVAYVRTTLPRVLANPTSENFASFMAPEDKAKLSAVAMIQFYSYINSNYGAFQACDDDLSGSSFVNFSPSGKTITAKYFARCHFSKASVTATVSLRKAAKSWNLVGVFFDSNSVGPATKVAGPSGQRI